MNERIASRWVLPELTGIGARPSARASLASLASRSAPAISPRGLAAVNGPKPGGQKPRSELSDEVGDLGLEGDDGGGELAQAAQLAAGDPDGIVCSAGEPTADAAAPFAREQCAARQLQLRPEAVQVPLQRVVEGAALTDKACAMVDQQPQVEFGPGERRRRQRLQPGGKGCARDHERVDRARFTARLGAITVFSLDLITGIPHLGRA